MMCGLRRARLTSLLAIATLVWVVSLSTSSFFHNETDDATCNPALVLHDHAAHHVVADARSARNAPEHCFICHWHSLRTVQTLVAFLAPPTESRLFARVVADRAALAIFTHQPARAPPLG
jgi:hypothetical protein